MTAQPVPTPSFSQPIVDRDGYAERWFSLWISAVFDRLGGKTDKVDAAYQAAIAAVPAATEVVAGPGLQGGSAIGGNVGVGLYRAITTVAMLPATGNNIGDFAYALDGCKAGESTGSGTGTPCWWSAGSPGSWRAVDSGAAVSA